MSPRRRATIFVEDAVLIEQRAFAAEQIIVRVHAPKCAAAARPGMFAHVACDPAIPMRRPLSIMRVSPADGWVEFLYKIVGIGLRHLTERRPGDTINMMGPIGEPFQPNPSRPRPLLIGGGVGIPPMVFLAEMLAADPAHRWQPLVLMGSEVPFPFETHAAAAPVAGMPAEATDCISLIEGWGIPSRLASGASYAGCFSGFVTELAATWLGSLDTETLSGIGVFACGPTPMLRAAAAVAKSYGLPCQVSLEEFMACATGGCAGCTVAVHTDQGLAMKRVCVDGPVFEARTVFK